ncbi:transcription factor GTE10-like [Euphorbia lathyris]|uniref:transcription factor GTE10-like n=1 Tax=Euphorbia lathyris TaxID=212925 RepID=UPI0033138CAF
MAPTVPIEFVGQKESRKCWLSQPMGKSRKYSKGHLTGFVPDYRHAVETVGESEGFGSSGRLDTEMTVSEGSYAPKRKLISLNPDGHDSFGVPVEVLPLSKMSRSERKNLKLKLKNDLQLVRVLQKKVASLNSNAVILSPSSDIWSCSDGQKKPSVEGLHRSVEVSASQSRKKVPPGRNGAKTKKAANGHQKSVKPAAPGSTLGDTLMKQCETLLQRLMQHQFGWVFNEPVDVVKLKIPDYFTVIKHPMDLGTVKRKITSGAYSSPLGFAADVRLTFSNALKYNPPGNDVHIMAEALGKLFESKFKAIEKKLLGAEQAPPGACVAVKMETNIATLPSKKKKIAHDNNKVKSEPVRRVMTDEEKHSLSKELEALLGELPESIIDFLKEHSHNADQTGEDEIEIDIDALSNDTLFKLRKLLDDFLLEKRKNPGKAEPCEMELPNESGFSNSSLPQCKGNEPVDEDIDIVGGGNDPLISSYPPVEIEKDAANKNSKCSSSSSSSGESGSSSDSDSASSSDSESEAAKAPVPGTATKENVGSVDNFEQKRSDLVDTDIGNQSANGLGTVEPDSRGKPTSMEVDGLQDGESDPPERQVSPDKLYRAAILRNRFADTIFKARAKALEKVEKLDPEKLRLEKEELERRQKEEKARLLAEARAAEEAQKKAAAEAAAEAKRKREEEREAARQALQQMEKTVDINENSYFMEDLEMLRATHDEELLPSFIEETIQGSSNPLEQLGLYIKNDDDDEEEVVEPPQRVPEPVKDVDVEEGEID